MDRLEWEASFSNNAIIVISSPRAGEEGVARRLVDDLTQLRLSEHPFALEHVVLKDRHHLVETMHNLARRAKKGMRPIIHLDMHGDPRRGLEIANSKEYAGWQELFAWLRKVNIRTKNNLGVVGAACFALSLIRSISISEPVPFYFLVAPQTEVNLGQIDDRMVTFYRTLLSNRGLSAAVEGLGAPFQLFHCEKMLTIVLGRYIKQQCKGRGAAARKEWLVTEALARGLPKSKETLKLLRQGARDHLKPTNELIERYADRFLMGREYGVTLEMLLELAG